MGVRKRENNQADKAGETAAGKASSRAGRTRKPRKAAAQGLSAEQRHRLIAETAYLLAEQRGFDPDGCLNDWLQAEHAVDGRLLSSEGQAENVS